MFIHTHIHILNTQIHVHTGDAAPAVAAVAASVGVDDPAAIHAQVKPGGKAAVVRELKQQGRVVAMVGDGVNDAAALAEVCCGYMWAWSLL